MIKTLCVTLLTVVICEVKAQGQEGRELDFAELIAIADRYDLHVPPSHAVPVGAAMYSRVDQETGKLVGVYAPAFLIGFDMQTGEARVLEGWRERVVRPIDDANPATRTSWLDSRRSSSRDYIVSFQGLKSFTTVVQLAQRDEREQAQDLWQHILKEEHNRDVRTSENLASLRTDPRRFLALCLYWQWHDQFFVEESDPNVVYQKLVQLRDEFPALFLSSDRGDLSYHRSEFIDDLGITIETAIPAEGSVEAMLIEWGNQVSQGGNVFGYFDERNEIRHQSARDIFREGISAIPKLLDLVGDRRLTKHRWPPLNNGADKTLRLGDLSQQLLNAMSGTSQMSYRRFDRDTWRAFDGLECDFFAAAATEIEEGKVVQLHEVPLRILGEKYPESLVDIAETVALQATDNLSYFRLSEAILHANLTNIEISQTLIRLCEETNQLEQKRGVLYSLAVHDRDRCEELLRPIIRDLPTDSEKAYWSCPPGSFGYLVGQMGSVELWTDYARATQRATVGLRLEMIQVPGVRTFSEDERRMYLAFLASFIDDDSLRDASISPERFSGPNAASLFEKIEVRDYVSLIIAFRQDWAQRPDDSWSSDQWAELRNKVKQMFEEEGIVPLIATRSDF